MVSLGNILYLKKKMDGLILVIIKGDLMYSFGCIQN